MSAAAAKPNILLITADQWRGDCLSALGHACVRTPNIDALAAEGTLFARHYAGAAPCSPARASLYTGLYQMNHRVCRNGSPLDDRFDNIARMARRAGYDPTLFGYTDVSLDPRALAPGDPHLTTYEGVLPGFAVRELLPEHEKPWLSWLRSRGHTDAASRDVHAPHRGAGRVSNAPPRYDADETQTAYLTDAFLRWHSEREEPWFAHLSFMRPHPPFIVPEPYNTMFSAQDGPDFIRAVDREAEAALHPWRAFQLAEGAQSGFVHGATGRVRDWTSEEIATLRAVYYGMIAEVDAQIGRLIAGLKAAGQWGDTILIFCSDHGEMAGDHWLLGKGGFFEASYHIPLVIRDPAQGGARRVVRSFTSAADIMPTLAERLGQSSANHQDGRSLMPFLEGAEPARWRKAAFWEFDFRDIAQGRAEAHFDLPSHLCNLGVLRDDAFKYVHFAGLPPLLFDLAQDPGELRNLAEEPAYAAVRLHFAEALLSLRAAHLDQTLADTTLTSAGPVTRHPAR